MLTCWGWRWKKVAENRPPQALFSAAFFRYSRLAMARFSAQCRPFRRSLGLSSLLKSFLHGMNDINRDAERIMGKLSIAGLLPER
jgi:hypothetical protein